MTSASTPQAPSEKTAERDKASQQLVDRLTSQAATVSTGKVKAQGKSWSYKTSVSFLPIASDDVTGAASDPEAAIMATSYFLDGAHKASQRPVCFAFNGGPGSSSIWLHMGALGPQRIVVPDDASSAKAPFEWEENPHTWLTHFDLIFIDPPHTGWSTTASEQVRKKMLSVDGDVTALAEAIRLWLTRHKRWGSPVYIAGESYGTTRGAALADKLQGMGVSLNGLILVSCAMDLQSLVFSPGNDLPYALFLPAFANTSQYHGLLKGDLASSGEAARKAAEAFVQEDYIAALFAGARLSRKQFGTLSREIARLTGLPSSLVEQKNLRISDQTYFFEALRAGGLQVGRLDSRAKGPLAAQQTQAWDFDPSIEAIAPAYTMACMAYFSQALGTSIESRYQVLSLEVNKGWDWRRGDSKNPGELCGFTSTTPDLSRALRKNPHLKVMVASGRYDLGTPYSASDWSIAQLDVSPDVLGRVQHHYYDAGHMMYTRQADLSKLKSDMADFVRNSQ